jgi:hypothetical protein
MPSSSRSADWLYSEGGPRPFVVQMARGTTSSQAQGVEVGSIPDSSPSSLRIAHAKGMVRSLVCLALGMSRAELRGFGRGKEGGPRLNWFVASSTSWSLPRVKGPIALR